MLAWNLFWRFGDLKKSAKFNFTNYFLMPNMHGVRWCETRGEIQQWHLPMPEEERECQDETIRLETITRVGSVHSCLLQNYNSI